MRQAQQRLQVGPGYVMNATIKKLGLALSGGGFRATLYHLGLVRFLRDAGILSRVSQITSVSGGSIIAAHLVLNWGRYNGSPEDFEAAAAELLAFVRLDVRNRILRRFPLTLPLRWLLRLLGVPTASCRAPACWNTTTRSTFTATKAFSSCP